jgi:hypothetical protein
MPMLLLLTDVPRKEDDERLEKLLIDCDEVKQRLKHYFKDAKSYKLEDLYEVYYGLPEIRYRPVIKTSDNREIAVHFLRSHEIRENDQVAALINSKVRNITEDADRSKEKADDKNNQRSDIPEKYLLNQEDLLINTRNLPQLITLENIEVEKNVCLVASHHFIMIRPKKHLLVELKIDAGFLSSLLKTSVAQVFQKRYRDEENKIRDEIAKHIREKKAKRSLSSSIPSVKIDDVKLLPLLIPSNQENQSNVFDTMHKLKDLQKEISVKMEMWEKEIYDLIGN